MHNQDCRSLEILELTHFFNFKKSEWRNSAHHCYFVPMGPHCSAHDADCACGTWILSISGMSQTLFTNCHKKYIGKTHFKFIVTTTWQNELLFGDFGHFDSGLLAVVVLVVDFVCLGFYYSSWNTKKNTKILKNYLLLDALLETRKPNLPKRAFSFFIAYNISNKQLPGFHNNSLIRSQDLKLGSLKHILLG